MEEHHRSTAIGEWTYRWREVPRPFVHPVTTPSGHVLSTDSPADHPWHHALWFTIKFVNGENFWEEYDDFGLLVQDSPPSVTLSDDGSTRAVSHLEWHRPSGDSVSDDGVVLREVRVMEQQRLSADASSMDWDIRLTPLVDVTLDRTPFTTWGGYGGLTLRGSPDWHDSVLRLPDGAERARVLGERAPWCALDGAIGLARAPQGVQVADPEVGMVMLDHPGNPKHPTPWYASTRADTYGAQSWANFVNAAFLWDGPIRLPAGDELRLRHRFIAHDGRWSLGRIDEAWCAWTTLQNNR
jgi:hypothetical protein